MTAKGNQFQCQTGRKIGVAKGVDGDKWIVYSVDDQAGDGNPGDQRRGAAASVVVGGPGEAVARRDVQVVKVEEGGDLRQVGRAEVGERVVAPGDVGAEPSDEVAVVDPIGGAAELAAARGQVDRRVGGQDAVEALERVGRGLRRQLQDKVASE